MKRKGSGLPSVRLPPCDFSVGCVPNRVCCMPCRLLHGGKKGVSGLKILLLIPVLTRRTVLFARHRAMLKMQLPLLMLAVAAGGWSAGSAQAAQVWEYIDEQGNAYYASTQKNSKYRLYYSDEGVGKTVAQSITSAALHAANATDGAVAAGKPVTESSTVVAKAGALKPRMQPRVKATHKGILYVQKAGKYAGLRKSMQEAAEKYRVDYELIQAVVAAESGFDAQAVSHRGAVGLMQVLPSTAKGLGVKASAEESVAQRLLNPHTNIMTGTRYLRDLSRLFKGRIELVVAAYNAGQGTVRRSGNAIPNYRETQRYVTKVLTLYAALKPSANISDVKTLVAQSTQGYEGRASAQPSLVVKNGTMKVTSASVSARRASAGKAPEAAASGGHVRLGAAQPALVVSNTAAGVPAGGAPGGTVLLD